MSDSARQAASKRIFASNQLLKAARILRQGGVVAYATEAVFGLGCDPRDRSAVTRLLRLKRRHVRKGLILIAADPEQLTPYVSSIPNKALASWPGPVTWLLEARADTPHWLTGRHASLAVRVSAHPQVAALCRLAGMAIVSTSANLSGQQPVRTYREALRRLGGRVDYVLPGRVGKRRLPSTIIDAASGRVIRPG